VKVSGQILALAALPSRKERRLGGLQTYLKKRKIVLAFKIFYFYLILNLKIQSAYFSWLLMCYTPKVLACVFCLTLECDFPWI
jgi:hypothetical protein